ncbi:Transposon Ty3-I Gag-Pol polyprotein [Pelomyxa schiedti]|nr:Transposon Ty3-I Gag-Pol polyprotein [Pelomyxa schiedti]
MPVAFAEEDCYYTMRSANTLPADLGIANTAVKRGTILATLDKAQSPRDKKFNTGTPLSTTAFDTFNWATALGHLEENQKEEIRNILTDFKHLFVEKLELGAHTTVTGIVDHVIDTGEARPVIAKGRKHSEKEHSIIEEETRKYIKMGIVRPSFSNWSSPVVLAPKKDGTVRFCVNYRKLNSVTRRDVHPLPHIEECLSTLAENAFLTLVDLCSGYWQVPIAEQDKSKTAFMTRQGLFEFNVLHFGLCNAPATFQRLMNIVLSGLLWEQCLVYIDDILIFGRTLAEHNARLHEVLVRLDRANLHIRLSKCDFAKVELQYLGHMVSPQGIRINPTLIQAVADFPKPQCVKDVQSFLGRSGKSIPGFAISILGFPDMIKPFCVESDASGIGVGATLYQVTPKGRSTIAYWSRVSSCTERNYDTRERECLAAVEAIKHWRQYLHGATVTLYTDHAALKYLMEAKNLTGRLARTDQGRP